MTEPLKPFLDVVIVSSQMHVYISQTDRGEVLMGAEIEPWTTYRMQGTLNFLQEVSRHTLELFPQLERARMLRSWAGLCDLSPDYSPILGKTEVEGFHVSAGWGTYGFKAAPIVGKTLAELVATGTHAGTDRAVQAGALLRGQARVRARRGRGEPLISADERSTMKSSLEIAQEAELLPIESIAERAGLLPDEFEPYGRYKAKISLGVLDRLADAPDGKLVCVAGVTPTKAGEGKTTTAVSLTQGLGKIGKDPVLCLREPSLGPVFGIKGGAAGGGLTQVVPMEDLNLHFTGDIHAIGAANNLLAALLDASILHGNPHKIDALRVGWKRALDMNDRALRQITLGLGGRANGYPRESGFDITAASEVMAILAVSRDLHDLRKRLGAITVAHSFDGGKPVTAEDLGAAGAMTVLLKEAHQAEPDPDARGPAVPDARGPVREHRARQLVAGGRPDRAEARRLRDHRVRLRLGHGDGEVLRHRLPQGRDRTVGGRAGRHRPRAEAPRRHRGRPARGARARPGGDREGRGQPASATSASCGRSGCRAWWR